MPSPRRARDRAAHLLHDRIKRVFKELPGAVIGKEDPVHQLRVAGRRLRVALPMLALKPRGKRVRRALSVLRDLTRTTGAGRDLDVLLELFERRLRATGEVSREQAVLLRRLRAARTRSRRRLTDGLLDQDIAGLRRDLRKLTRQEAADVFTVLARVRAIREAQGAALLLGFAEVGERYDPEALHALRRRARRLRYAAEIGDALRGEESSVPAVWKRLQDAIGALHDCHVLAGWLEEQAAAAEARGGDVLARAAREEQAALVAEGHRLHRELLESRPAELAAGALDAMGRGRSVA
jgi:CHAD domain-containing protein